MAFEDYLRHFLIGYFLFIYFFFLYLLSYERITSL